MRSFKGITAAVLAGMLMMCAACTNGTQQDTAQAEETVSVSEAASASSSEETAAAETPAVTEEAAPQEKTEDNGQAADSGDVPADSTADEESDIQIADASADELSAEDSYEEEISGFEALFEEALKCAGEDDKDSFYALFADNDSEEIKTLADQYYSFFKESFIPDDFPDYGYSVLWGDGTYYMGFVLNTLCEGEYPDTTYKMHSGYMAFSNREGKWLFDYSEESQAALGGVEATRALYPEGMFDAAVMGRNSADFCNGDYSWINAALIVPGTVDSKLYLAWQDEDGNLYCLVNVKNGLERDYDITDISFRLDDDNLGKIVTASSGRLGKLPAGEAKNYILTIDAKDVLTGSEIWEAPGVQIIGTVE